MTIMKKIINRENSKSKIPLIINNEQLLDLLKFNYTLDDIQHLSEYLKTKETFNFPQLNNNLFSAGILTEKTEYTGYNNVWVRDNIYVAYSHYLLGETEVATKNVRTLMDYFRNSEQRFKKIIERQVTPLLWTQANLRIALNMMEQSLS